jgi:hypothetical protein
MEIKLIEEEKSRIRALHYHGSTIKESEVTIVPRSELANSNWSSDYNIAKSQGKGAYIKKGYNFVRIDTEPGKTIPHKNTLYLKPIIAEQLNVIGDDLLIYLDNYKTEYKEIMLGNE